MNYSQDLNRSQVKIEESEDEAELLTIVIDEDQDSSYEKTEEKWKFLNHQFHMKLVTRKK